MNARWKERIGVLIGAYPRLLGIGVHNKLHAEGFAGGYSTVTRELRAIRGPRFRAADGASMPIHTDPGEEFLCGFLHRASYVEPANMRHSPATCRAGAGRGFVGT